MIFSTRAIVLQAFPFNDTSHIVSLYTLSHGRLGVLVRGINSKSKRFNSNYFQPLTIMDIELQYLENRELQRLKDISLIFSPTQIVFDIRKNCIAQFLCEFLNKTLRESEANALQLEYLMNAVRLLEIIDKGVENFHVVFLLQFSKFLGVYPDRNTLTGTLSFIAHSSLETCDNLRLTRLQRNDMFQQLLLHYATHFEGVHQFKSIKVLHEILS